MSSNKIELKTTQELLDSFYEEMLPYALHCGMTTEEFWYGEPRVLCSFIKKHDLYLDEMNYNAWLFGLYTHKAIGVVLTNAFSQESSIKDTYFEKPLEELYSEYNLKKTKKQKETNKKDYRQQINYWAKIGKKGV